MSERLTERVGDGIRYDNGEYIVTCYPKNGNLTPVDKIAAKLCEFEDKIENGTMIALPCAIGTKIYELCFEKEDPCSWCEHDHSGFGDYICDFDYDPYPEVKDLLMGKAICPKNQMKVIERTFDLYFYQYDKDWFNITWFLTKEEAEKALAERSANNG